MESVFLKKTKDLNKMVWMNWTGTGNTTNIVKKM